jgi:hypothetical protein
MVWTIKLKDNITEQEEAIIFGLIHKNFSNDKENA